MQRHCIIDPVGGGVLYLYGFGLKEEMPMRCATRCVFILLGCICLAGAAVSGCSPRSIQPQAVAPPPAWYRYFPAVTDTVWVYELVVSDAPADTVQLLQTRVNDVTADRIAVMSGSSPVTYMIVDDGLIKAKSGNYFLKYPLTAGNRWPITLGGKDGEAVIASDNENITTTAGTFTGCLLVEERPVGEPVVLRTWLAPNVGVVRMQTVVIADGKEYVNEQADLHSYARP